MKNPMLEDDLAARLREEAAFLPSWDLSSRQLLDLELLLNGGFFPLGGYLGRADYHSVCRDMRMENGVLWPIPITLDISEQCKEECKSTERLALRHPEGMILAVLNVSDIWRPDLEAEAMVVYGTSDESHPGVAELFDRNPVHVGGTMEGLELPTHHTFRDLRHTPSELRELFKKLEWRKIIAFQTRNPIHRAHAELARRAATETGANLLIHPIVGTPSPADLDYFIRVRCYKAALRYFPQQTTMLSLLPLAMRMAGPREALWHAIIRRNYGCTHLIVGRDHAGPGKDAAGASFYPPYAAQELALQHQDEVGIEIVPSEELVYVEDLAEYLPLSEIPEGAKTLSLSGTELRRRLRRGLEIPGWFSYPEVVEELRHSFPPRARQGFTVFLTGLPAAGKSTVAQVLMTKLMEIRDRPVTLLDGDIVRKNLSSELGFSREHRDLNIQRIGFVASEITKNRGICICAPIAPYRATRRKVRELIEHYGGFIEVYVSTPLEVCEGRDRKGLYARARAGLIRDFTGINDPYEPPQDPEVSLDCSQLSAEASAHEILLYLEGQGFIGAGQSRVGAAPLEASESGLGD